jgi:hypothetical protein
MENDVIFDKPTGAVYVKSLNAMVTPAGSSLQKVLSSVEIKKGIFDWVPWGNNNLFPQEIIEYTRKSHVLAAALNYKIRMAIGDGLAYGYNDLNETTGRVEFKRLIIPEIEQFLRNTHINDYLWQTYTDMYTFANPFARLIKGRGTDKIVALYAERAEQCRWGWQDDFGIIKECFLNANWKSRTNANTLTLPVLDAFWDPVGQLIDSSKRDFILSTAAPTPGCNYYQIAPYTGVVYNGWLEFALKIPRFKEAMMNNQMNLFYHIEIPYSYWSEKYKDKGWDKMSDDEQAEIMRKQVKAFLGSTTGPDNSGSSIISGYHSNKNTGAEWGGWKVKAIDSRAKEGMYVEDSMEASLHVYNALGIDPTILGNLPGKSFGAGSGSDKRVAQNIQDKLANPDRAFALRPLDVVTDYNEWHTLAKQYAKKDVVIIWKPLYSEITTTDSGKELKPAA